MAYLRIHCDVCGGTWEIYNRDDWDDDRARQCPHCFSKIDRQTWHKQIVPAFTAVNDANAELFKDHVGYHYPLFTFDVIADHIYKNRPAVGGRCPVYDDVRDILDELYNEDIQGLETLTGYKKDPENPYKNCPNKD